MFTARAIATAPVDRLWTVLSDVTAWPDHLPTFTSVTLIGGPTPMGLGSRFVVRQPGLPAATYEVTDWEPGRGFTWVARSIGVATTATHVATASEVGRWLDLTIRWDGPVARPLQLMLGRRVQRMIELEATTLARVAAAGE